MTSSASRAGHATVSQVLGARGVSLSEEVRRAVLAAMNSTKPAWPTWPGLNFLARRVLRGSGTGYPAAISSQSELVGCHGQTLYHQGEAARFLGRKLGGHLADWRGCGYRGPGRRACGFRFSSRRYGCRRQRRSAGSLPRLLVVSRSRASAELCRTSVASRTSLRFLRSCILIS